MNIVKKRRPATEKDSPCAVALGFFDGLHTGHAAVIAAAKSCAEKNGLRLAVFTFDNGPKAGKESRLILTEQEKHRQLQLLAVDTCYQPPFASFGGLSPTAFFEEMLLAEYRAKAIFCGQNFAFGANRKGNVPFLQKLCQEKGLTLCAVPTANYMGQAVSSSRIRSALAKGDMPAVNAMLGRPYQISFAVEEGKKLGTKLGMPTINQHFLPNIQPPAFGVYITQAFVNGGFVPSVTGFGARPTVGGTSPSCETFIPNFSANLYGQKVDVRFYKKIADVEKHENLPQLAKAVQAFAQQALAYFA